MRADPADLGLHDLQLLVYLSFSTLRSIFFFFKLWWSKTEFLGILYLFTVLANIFIMRRSAANKVLKKKEQEQPKKNAQKLSAEINSEILFSSPLV